MNPRDEAPDVGGLGKRLDDSPPPQAEWRYLKPGFEINAKGQIRTSIPQNELANHPAYTPCVVVNIVNRVESVLCEAINNGAGLSISIRKRFGLTRGTGLMR